MRLHWEKQTGNRTDSIDLTDGQVFVGVDEGFGHGSYGAASSYADFLAGNLNDIVESAFDSGVLEEVRKAVAAAT